MRVADALTKEYSNRETSAAVIELEAYLYFASNAFILISISSLTGCPIYRFSAFVLSSGYAKAAKSGVSIGIATPATMS